VRWLLLKDLQILRRSPLLVALLVIYPIVIAVLFGLALSGGPEKPRVAFAFTIVGDRITFTLGEMFFPAGTVLLIELDATTRRSVASVSFIASIALIIRFRKTCCS